MVARAEFDPAIRIDRQIYKNPPKEVPEKPILSHHDVFIPGSQGTFTEYGRELYKAINLKNSLAKEQLSESVRMEATSELDQICVKNMIERRQLDALEPQLNTFINKIHTGINGHIKSVKMLTKSHNQVK